MEKELKSAYETRQLILSKSRKIVEELIDIGLGHANGDPDKQVLLELFKHISPAIKMEDDGLSLKETASKMECVTDIISQMQRGEITPKQAQEAIEALNKGADLSELEGLVDRLKNMQSI